jgi:hypothetical protein
MDVVGDGDIVGAGAGHARCLLGRRGLDGSLDGERCILRRTRQGIVKKKMVTKESIRMYIYN